MENGGWNHNGVGSPQTNLGLTEDVDGLTSGKNEAKVETMLME